MTPRGRPLWFLGSVMGGWVIVRTALLWPEGLIPEVTRTLVQPAAAERPARAPAPIAEPVPARRTAAARPALHAPSIRYDAPFRKTTTPPAPATLSPSVRAIDPPPALLWSAPAAAPLPAFAPGLAPPVTASRWSASLWAIARPGGRATPFVSQLGGSQMGARLAYTVDRGRRLAVYVRASAALDSRQQEAAVGLDWQPTPAPVHLVVERRIGVAGIAGGTAAAVIGGIGPVPVGAGFRLEGYGQAGVILRDRAEGFADGSARLTRALGPIDLGLGAWGAAQRGAERVDMGPTIGLGVKVAGRTVRLTADWRQRVVGDARPGSGPAVSMGVDF